jgi:hypothetical protein
MAPDSVSNLLKYQKNGVRVIFFGDSSVISFSQNDKNPQTTAAMLNALIGASYPVGQVAHNSYQPAVYDAYTGFMVRQGYFPDYIVIPVNLRSFSPTWDLRANFQFVDELLYLQYYQSQIRYLLTFLINMATPDVNRIYENIFSFTPIYDGETKIGTGSSYEAVARQSTPYAIRTKAMLQMFYLGTIHGNHRKIHNLMNIIDRFKNTKTKVLFYITPIDFEIGNSYFGNRFEKQIKQNAEVVSAELTNHGGTVVDLSLAQHTDNFMWQEEWYVDEHLNEHGRLFLATTIASIIDSTFAAN